MAITTTREIGPVTAVSAECLWRQDDIIRVEFSGLANNIAVCFEQNGVPGPTVILSRNEARTFFTECLAALGPAQED